MTTPAPTTAPTTPADLDALRTRITRTWADHSTAIEQVCDSAAVLLAATIRTYDPRATHAVLVWSDQIPGQLDFSYVLDPTDADGVREFDGTEERNVQAAADHMTFGSDESALRYGWSQYATHDHLQVLLDLDAVLADPALLAAETSPEPQAGQVYVAVIEYGTDMDLSADVAVYATEAGGYRWAASILSERLADSPEAWDYAYFEELPALDLADDLSVRAWLNALWEQTTEACVLVTAQHIRP